MKYRAVFIRFIGIFLALLSTSAASARNLSGVWNGKLDVGPAMSLRVVLNVVSKDSITLDSPDQGAFDIPAKAFFLSDDSISVSMRSLKARYKGALHGDSLVGTFTQGPMKLPLTLSRGEVQIVRPQAPEGPFPYIEEELAVPNPDAPGVTLAGTLTVPAEATAASSVVVMVTGSGAQNRDEELFGHRPFAVIADYLARRGIATLRYDDRGYAASTGNAATVTTPDNASDAAALVAYLRGTGRFGKVGLLGHSEGGMVAAMLGARADSPDFLVAIAGPTVRGDSISMYQNRFLLKQQGLSQTEIDSIMGEIEEKLAQSTGNPWVDFFMHYSPGADLAHIHVPTLFIYGGKDMQVPAVLNEAGARRVPGAHVLVLPALNHAMQHADTGLPNEYAEISETISPDVLSAIAAFILANTLPK